MANKMVNEISFFRSMIPTFLDIDGKKCVFNMDKENHRCFYQLLETERYALDIVKAFEANTLSESLQLAVNYLEEIGYYDEE